MVGITPPPAEWVGDDGKPIYFDSIDNSAYILGKSPASARTSWIYIDGENFQGVRADIGDDPANPWLNIAWKYLYTAKDSWLGPEQNLGSIGSLYNLTMDPYEKYDMIFNGAAPMRAMTTSPGRYAGQDNGWVGGVIGQAMVQFDQTLMKFPSIQRYPGGASNDLVPNLQQPDDPAPFLKNMPPLPPTSLGGG
jgi:arylsulfatase